MYAKLFRRIFIYGLISLMLYILGVFLFSEMIPSWRYSRDKKDTIENFRKHETTFDKIRNDAIELPKRIYWRFFE